RLGRRCRADRHHREGRKAEGGDGRDPRRDRLRAGGERRGVREVLRPEGRGMTGPAAGFPDPAYPLGANPSFADLLRASTPEPAGTVTGSPSGTAPAFAGRAEVPYGTTVLAIKFAAGVVMAGD